MPLLISTYDRTGKGEDRLICSARTTVQSLLTAATAKREEPLTNDGKAYGTYKVVKAKATGDKNTEELMPHRSFIDYITGGYKLEMYIAINVTDTFGDESLLTDYQSAIKEAVEVISKYDTDGMYPVWGFGARFGGKMQNCFDIGNIKVKGVEGVLRCYQAVH